MKQAWLILLFLIASISFHAEAKKDKDAVPEYTIEGAGTATQGNYLVKVTVISKNKHVTDEQIRRAAVHGVLFRGFSNSEKRQSQKPLAGSLANEAQHADFYNDFFSEDGLAKNYASPIEGSRSIKKVDKKYHVTSTVTVSKESLLKFLQDAGVVKGLNSAF